MSDFPSQASPDPTPPSNSPSGNIPSPSKRFEASPTNLIIGANIVAFILMGLAGAGWVETADITPYIRYGANSGELTTNGEWWRLVTSMFLHYGAMHLLFNMWALYQAGDLLERLFGKVSFFLIYFGAGILGSFTTLVWHGDKVLSAGASGAIFGVYGAIVGYMLREKHGLPRRFYQPILNSTLLFTGYNLFYGFIHPQIDNADHIGGMLGGLILGWIVAPPVRIESRASVIQHRRWLGLAVLGVMSSLGFIFTRR